MTILGNYYLDHPKGEKINKRMQSTYESHPKTKGKWTNSSARSIYLPTGNNTHTPMIYDGRKNFAPRTEAAVCISR